MTHQSSDAGKSCLIENLLRRRAATMGVNAPLFYDDPLIIQSGHGVWLTDHKGRSYLDAYNNVPHVGHSNPTVVEAVCRQMRQVNTSTRYLSEEVIAYHERLLSTFTREINRLMLTCTGSEANDLALRIARLVTGRTGVIVTDFTYHGNTHAVSEISSGFGGSSRQLAPHVRVLRSPFVRQSHTLGHVERERQQSRTSAEFLFDLDEAIASLNSSGHGVSALLIDPLFSTEGVAVPPDGLIATAVERVREHGGLYIADEVQSGLGRTGQHWWGYELHGAVPDLVTLGKPLGNGYPLAGLAGRASLVDSFRQQVDYFNTFAGSNAACAAGTAVLDVIEREDLIANASRVGELIRDGLYVLQKADSRIKEIRGAGLFVAVELDDETREVDSLSPNPSLARRVANAMRHRGVLVSTVGSRSNVLKIRPPLVFGSSDTEILLQTLRACLMSSASELDVKTELRI